jgi:hypothetical protein
MIQEQNMKHYRQKKEQITKIRYIIYVLIILLMTLFYILPSIQFQYLDITYFIGAFSKTDITILDSATYMTRLMFRIICLIQGLLSLVVLLLMVLNHKKISQKLLYLLLIFVLLSYVSYFIYIHSGEVTLYTDLFGGITMVGTVIYKGTLWFYVQLVLIIILCFAFLFRKPIDHIIGSKI